MGLLGYGVSKQDVSIVSNVSNQARYQGDRGSLTIRIPMGSFCVRVAGPWVQTGTTAARVSVDE